MSDESKLSVVILAAGEGTRMRSDTAKVLFPVCGRPMIEHILNAASAVRPDTIVVVVGHKGEEVRREITGSWAESHHMEGRLEFAWQLSQKGTGHAAACARSHLPGDCGHVMILCGDTPLITGEMLQTFVQFHLSEETGLSFITTVVDDPGAYGRVRRDCHGRVARIVEANDLLPGDEQIREVNAGIYLVRKDLFDSLLSRLDDNNAKHEFYLTDVVEMAVQDGFKVSSFVWQDSSVVQGVNDRHALALAEARLREAIIKDLCLSGVTVRDPQNTYVDYGVKVGRNTVLEPGTFLRGRTRIGEGCIIGPCSEINDSLVGDNSKVWFSVVEDSEIKKRVEVGPYSHIRPGTCIEPEVLVGNFAEVKNCVIGSGSKVHHHSYLGDSVIGRRVNIGAGTVTVNYDGISKHKTVIEDGAFIGCNANLIAPVKIGKGAYVAAGSTITSDVPGGSLGIARERQANKEGWVAKRTEKMD